MTTDVECLCYLVFNRKTETALRAFTLEEVREAIRDMLKRAC